MTDSSKSQYEPQVFVLLLFSRGGESRLKILSALNPPKNYNEIAKETEHEWWTAQRHLQVLLKENLIKKYDFGRIKFYSITTKGQEAIKAIENESQGKLKMERIE